MQKIGPYYIGSVSLTSLRGWILNSELTQADTVLLHTATMETVMEEYRQLYREPMPDPYFLLGVLLEEATDVRVPENRVVALIGDERTERPVHPDIKPAEPTDDGRNVYRCGRCGDIVNSNGEVLHGAERDYSIFLLRTRGDDTARHREGECCKDRTH